MKVHELADAYFRYVEDGVAEAFAATEDVEDLVRSDPEHAWRVIQVLIESAPSDHALSYVAAGPLENLLWRHGDAVAPMIRRAAENNMRVVEALHGVWLRESELSVGVQEHLSAWVKPVG